MLIYVILENLVLSRTCLDRGACIPIWRSEIGRIWAIEIEILIKFWIEIENRFCFEIWEKPHSAIENWDKGIEKEIAYSFEIWECAVTLRNLNKIKYFTLMNISKKSAITKKFCSLRSHMVRMFFVWNLLTSSTNRITFTFT